jgi:hypothetical protein
MFTIVVAARMVIDDREEKRTEELQWLERQEAREVRGVREVAVIDRRERAEQDILVVYRVVGGRSHGDSSCSLYWGERAPACNQKFWLYRFPTPARV